ncbi:MAG: hypothetical protein DHS80DRAFT_31317 [Piptocephalis tieghemiana]|nr:MAG: hypothetical protein DHS80DRAFT_31317 [Piptocephalis tieghemiana]
MSNNNLAPILPRERRTSELLQYKQALNEADDKRISSIRPLIPPQILMEDLPLTGLAAVTVLEGRDMAEKIIHGQDDRLLVVVGPCSIHDEVAALDYARKLAEYRKSVSKDLLIVMRVYFEKPRTTVGWKGLINDPDLNGSFQINRGLRKARKLLLDINELGIPVGCEFLDTISPQYTADLVTWGAIGARTTESQVHRELASGLSCPIGFKNGTDGGVRTAIDAIRAASAGHSFLSVTKHGLSAIVTTEGNDACHIILRGGSSGPNYSEDHVLPVVQALEKANLTPSIMVDCSHGNSEKVFSKQPGVAKEVARQMASSGPTSKALTGVMIESNLVEGRQDIPPSADLSSMTYGQSVTDACINWDSTVEVLDHLARAVQDRRKNASS